MRAEDLLPITNMGPLDPLSIIALALIVIIGLPHGAFDGAVALSLGYTRTLQGFVGFIVIYILISVLVVMFWLKFPELALVLFLGITVIHFGLSDTPPGTLIQRGIQIAAHGGMIVIATSMFHWSEVELIFEQLIGGKSEFLWPILLVCTYGFAGVLAFYGVLAYMRPALRLRLSELAILGVAYSVLPPLAGFALYFCGVHTPRHVIRIWRSLRKSERGWISVLPLVVVFTVISWTAGVVIFWLIQTAATVDSTIIRVIFIGLAALTVPHMILVDGLFHRRHKDF